MRPAALLALLALLAPAAAASQGASAFPAITVSIVERQPLVDRIHASGLIAPVERVLVQPQIEGQAIEAVLVEVGDRVVAGQVLARLSGSALELQKGQLEASRASAEAGVAQAAAQLAEAEALRDQALLDRDRALQLVSQGVATEAAADNARSAAASADARVGAANQALNASRAQVRVAEAQIAELDLQVQRTDVTAAVAGEVSDRNAEVGAIASMGAAPLFTLIRDGALELRADVAEQDILRLAPGQTARLTVVGLAEPLSGTVRLVEPTVDATTRLGRVRITIGDPGRVRAGMFADAEILATRRETLAVPASAVGSDGATAMRVEGGVVDAVEVETGIRDGGLVEILAGLAEGDTVVSKAGAFVRDGDRINPVPAGAAAN